MKRLAIIIAALLISGAALAQSMTGTITGLPGTSGTYTFSGTLTPPAPACTEITAPNGSLTSSDGATWTWGAVNQWGDYAIMRNGVSTNGSSVVLALASGAIYAKTNYSGTIAWWSYSSSGWTQLSAAPAGCN